jgi:hypothetical protein
MSVQATHLATGHTYITNLDLPGPVFASAVSTAVQLAAGQLTIHWSRATLDT